jgi:hypothetical protein
MTMIKYAINVVCYIWDCCIRAFEPMKW